MNNIYYLFSVKDKCFTDLSLLLKQKKIFSNFYGLAYAKTPILNNPIYNHISYISDLIQQTGEVDYAFLTEIEKTYQVNVADMIHADRHLLRYKKENRLFIAQTLLKTFIKEMQEFKIDFVLPEATDDFISFFAAYYCQHHQIKFFYPINIGFGDKACMSSNIYAAPNGFEEKFKETHALIKQGLLDASAIEKEIDDYVNAKKRPSYYISGGGADYHPFKVQDIKTFFNYLTAYFRDKNGMHYDRSPFLIPFYRAVKITRKVRYRNFLQAHSVDLAAASRLNYFIYPLHFEPESATLVQGRWFNDQRKIIEMISKNLPADAVLLVKEHKPSIGRRALKFYQDIVSHHNVLLVDDKIDTYRLIENSKGVIVISSTMGLEALMLKKPVMSFGERFYNVSNNVYKVHDYKAIDQVIRKMLVHEFDQVDSNAFFHTLMATTQNLGCLSHLEYRERDLEILADVILSSL